LLTFFWESPSLSGNSWAQHWF